MITLDNEHTEIDLATMQSYVVLGTGADGKAVFAASPGLSMIDIYLALSRAQFNLVAAAAQAAVAEVAATDR